MASQGMGVVSNKWFDRVLLSIHSLHVQTLMATDAQTPFLGTPLAPLKHAISLSLYIYIYIYTYAYDT